jgi:hypothetical protein
MKNDSEKLIQIKEICDFWISVNQDYNVTHILKDIKNIIDER